MPGLGIVVTARLDARLSEEVAALCERRGVSRAALVKHLLRAAVRLDAYAREVGGDEFAREEWERDRRADAAAEAERKVQDP